MRIYNLVSWVYIDTAYYNIYISQFYNKDKLGKQ